MSVQPIVEIFLLGEFKLIVNGVDIASRLKHSPKKILLLEYLIINKDKPVSIGNLIDVLWNGSDELSFENSLKTLVSRLRKDLADMGLDSAIVTKRGAYLWNPELDCKIDIFHIEELCKRLAPVTVLTEETRSMFDEVMLMYDSDVLVNSGISVWVAPKSYYYRNLYLETVYHYIRLLNDASDYNQIIRVCKNALEIDVFDSLINIELMQALMKIGKSKEALSQYQNVTDLHYTHLGIKPSDAILNFYKQLIMEVKNSESTIEKIYAELKQADSENDGAFVCDYSIFRDIYSLYMRNLRRQDVPMFLAIVSIQSIGMKDLNPIETDKAMKALSGLIQSNLRSGDTIARYSLNQYALLLPNVESYEVARMVMKRMQNLYYSDSDNSRYTFNFYLLKMDADEHKG